MMAAQIGLPAIALVLSVAGFWYARTARRLDDHPICRTCGFDLYGKPPTSDRCPECGRELNTARATYRGNRGRRPVLMAAFAMLALLCATWLMFAGVVIGKDIQIDHYKPLWMVLREARSGNPAIHSPAFTELQRRLLLGELAPEDLVEIAGEVLDLQADPTRAWNPMWGTWFEVGLSRGAFAPELRKRYIEQSIAATLQVRPRVRAGESLPVFTGFTAGRAGPGKPFTISANLVVRIDGHEICRLPGWYSRTRSGADARKPLAIPLTEEEWERLPPGKHIVELSLEGHYTDIVAPGRVAMPWGLGLQLGREAIVLTSKTTITVLPPQTPSVQSKSDEALREAIGNSISVIRVGAIARGNQAAIPMDLSAQIDLAPAPPVPVAFEVFARVKGTEWKLGELSSSAAQRLPVTLTTSGPPLDSEWIDLIFRSSEACAARTVDLTEIWQGELVIENIPVEPIRRSTEQARESAEAVACPHG